jgi:D-amino peptidase
MKVYVMTDLECVAGVVTVPEYCLKGPINKYGRAEGGRYYDHARELATLEVNAAIEGFLAGGATEVFVCDAHGHGGLNPSLIHPEARILTGAQQVEPRGLDDSFAAAVMIGQHAMANTDGGHLCHSGSFDRDDWILNGRTIGEIGLVMLACSYFGVPMVMISGDVAACEEARRLVPSIETVAVIEGQKRGSAKGMTVQQAVDFNVPAVHVSPVKSRRMIKAAARSSLAKIHSVERFTIDPPYEMVRITRPDEDGRVRQQTTTSDDYVDLLQKRGPYEYV